MTMQECRNRFLMSTNYSTVRRSVDAIIGVKCRGNVGQMNHLAILVDREKSAQITSSKISHLHFLL